MNVICPISGEPLIKSDFFLGLDYAEVHPIFRIPRSKLISADFVHRFSKAVETREKRLYYLATINSTDLVEFKTVAKPSLKLMEQTFLQAIQIAGWLDFASFKLGKDLSFPQYIVRKENEEMDTIIHWLSSLEKIRTDFLKKDLDRERSRILLLEQERLQKELNSAKLKDRAFTPVLAKWALEMADLEDHPKASRFLKILCTELSKAWSLSRDDLLELKELLTDELSPNHPTASSVFGQLNMLIAQQKKGFTDILLILEEPEGEILPGEPTLKRKEVGSEVYAEIYKNEYGHMNEPKPEQFEKKWQYEVAKCRWDLAHKKPDSPSSLSERV